MGRSLIVGESGARNELIIGSAHLQSGVKINYNHIKTFLISNFCCVLNVVCFLLGNFPAFEIYVLTGT
jgi:hypothetical protein